MKLFAKQSSSGDGRVFRSGVWSAAIAAAVIVLAVLVNLIDRAIPSRKTEFDLSEAGLNPHCGENGLFGTEEIKEIQPAIDEAMAEGICIPDKKPTPPATEISKAIGGWYDIVVCMDHDQGHIPLKTVGVVYDREKQEWKAVEGVNVTLGLPIIRASVDHGTDFYHAGKGNGNELSLVNAIKYAGKMTGRAN